jgi:hypothetical protein
VVIRLRIARLIMAIVIWLSVTIVAFSSFDSLDWQRWVLLIPGTISATVAVLMFYDEVREIRRKNERYRF